MFCGMFCVLVFFFHGKSPKDDASNSQCCTMSPLAKMKINFTSDMKREKQSKGGRITFLFQKRWGAYDNLEPFELQCHGVAKLTLLLCGPPFVLLQVVQCLLKYADKDSADNKG